VTTAGEPAKGQKDSEQEMLTPMHMELNSSSKAPLAGASSDHDIWVAGLTFDHRDSEGVRYGEICSLLIGRLKMCVFIPFIFCMITWWLWL
jgi:hypothetical protein